MQKEDSDMKSVWSIALIIAALVALAGVILTRACGWIPLPDGLVLLSTILLLALIAWQFKRPGSNAL